MARLTFKQLLLAIALGALFAALQGDPPVHALARLSTVPCSSSSQLANRC